MDKHYLSMFYGVDEALPDEEFVRQIKEINELARVATERMQDMSHLKIIQELESVTEIQARAIKVLSMRLAELGDTETGRDEIAEADKAYRAVIGGDEWPD